MTKYITTVQGKTFEVDILPDGTLLVNGEPRHVDFLSLSPALFSIIREYESHELVVEARDGNAIDVLMRGHLYNVEVLDERAQLIRMRRGGAAADSGEVSIKSPMPGLIVSIPVEEGQAIQAGQTVIILESMKMQNELKAPRDGTVQRVSVAAGQSVEQGKLLVTLT